MSPGSDFQVQADDSARQWLEAHPSNAPWAITYTVDRCCGGGKICQARVRQLSTKHDRARFVAGAAYDGREILIDRRAAAKLPRRFGLTVRGIGPFKHLDLALASEEWGTLLYD